jgi:hypothetical protein
VAYARNRAILKSDKNLVCETEGIYESARSDAYAHLLGTMEMPLPSFVFLADALISDMLIHQPHKT